MGLQLPTVPAKFISPEPILDCVCHAISMGDGVLITKHWCLFHGGLVCSVGSEFSLSRDEIGDHKDG